MIVVDISVPILEKSYDFNLNEEVITRSILNEIIDIISQKEGCFENSDAAGFSLFSCETHKCLNPFLSLSDNGVVDGTCLLLV